LIFAYARLTVSVGHEVEVLFEANVKRSHAGLNETVLARIWSCAITAQVLFSPVCIDCALREDLQGTHKPKGFGTIPDVKRAVSALATWEYLLEVPNQSSGEEDAIGINLHGPSLAAEAAVAEHEVPGGEEAPGVQPRAPGALLSLFRCRGHDLQVGVFAQVQRPNADCEVVIAGKNAQFPLDLRPDQVRLIAIWHQDQETEERPWRECRNFD